MGTINNLYIDQGASFSATVQVFGDDGDPYNLTGYTTAAQIRRNYNTNTISATFTTSVLSAANGTIIISLTPGQTSDLKYTRYVYDVEISSGGSVLRPVEGIITVYPQVTR